MDVFGQVSLYIGFSRHPQTLAYVNPEPRKEFVRINCIRKGFWLQPQLGCSHNWAAAH
jgi:hypothetical protein